MTRFFGKLFLINFAIGVVTGIVQEFQFGMNWSAYSRYVGDIFGAPLAMEGLHRLLPRIDVPRACGSSAGTGCPKRVHLATSGWPRSARSSRRSSSWRANSWMQHPVGYIDQSAPPIAPRSPRSSGRSDNSTLLVPFPHTIAAAVLTASTIVVGIRPGIWPQGREVEMFSRSCGWRLLVVFVVGHRVTALIGHVQAQIMTEQQPMKMAAAEALYTLERPARRSRSLPWRHSRSTQQVELRPAPARPALGPRHQLAGRQGRGHQHVQAQ